MTLEELNQYALTHPETDVDVDKDAVRKAKALERRGKVVILEGRIQYHFFPHSIKLYVKVDFGEGLKRIWADLQQEHIRNERNEGRIKSFQDLKRILELRRTRDVKRYRKYYGINPYHEKQYDIVIDTTKNTVEETREEVLQALIPFLKKEKI